MIIVGSKVNPEPTEDTPQHNMHFLDHVLLCGIDCAWKEQKNQAAFRNSRRELKHISHCSQRQDYYNAVKLFFASEVMSGKFPSTLFITY